MMILALHNLAESYKVLPSEALARASTFDLYVLDCHLKYSRYLDQKTQAENNGLPAPPKKLSQEEMMQMIKNVRQRS